MIKKQQGNSGVHVYFEHEASIHQHIITTQFFHVAASWKNIHPQEGGVDYAGAMNFPKNVQGTVQLNVKE